MNKYLKDIRKTVLQYLEDENVSVGLFGSRAKGEERKGSDVDIVIVTSEEFDRNKLTLLREKLELMNIPYKVDFVEISDVATKFAHYISSDIQWWKRQGGEHVIIE